jgi:hypothetical protein
MYYLQNRYQDSDWQDTNDTNEPFYDLERACRRAMKLSLNAVAYGMIRVIDRKGEVYGTYTSGQEV